jgi:hypothetical protein
LQNRGALTTVISGLAMVLGMTGLSGIHKGHSRKKLVKKSDLI